ncbi:MAG: FhaA domain-containing protein, partial [Ilumatobacteraceae bacterium]
MLQRVRRSGIRPISIGRALLAQVDAQFDDRGSSGALASRYVITLHPDDAALLTAFEAALLEELHQAVTHHAAIEGYTLSGDVKIMLTTDPSVKRGTCKVAAIALTTPEPIPPVAHRRAGIEPIVTTTIIADATIVLGSGERISLTDDLATVGRQSDCHVVIDDHNVSRIHAEIQRTANGW